MDGKTAATVGRNVPLQLATRILVGDGTKEEIGYAHRPVGSFEESVKLDWKTSADRLIWLLCFSTNDSIVFIDCGCHKDGHLRASQSPEMCINAVVKVNLRV